MAMPKSVKERLHRKMRLASRGRKSAKKVKKGKSFLGRVIPKKGADNDPIPKFRQAKESLLKLYHASNGQFDAIITEMDDSIAPCVLSLVNGLIKMCWQPTLHETKHVQFDVGRLHDIRESMEKICSVLDMERKLDLFSVIREMV